MTEWEKFERMVNLKSEYVEFATLKSMVAAVDKAYKMKEKADSLGKKAESSRVDAANAYSEAVNAFNSAKEEYSNLESKIKELGVAVPSETQSLVKNMERESVQANDGKNKFNSIKF